MMMMTGTGVRRNQMKALRTIHMKIVMTAQKRIHMKVPMKWVQMKMQMRIQEKVPRVQVQVWNLMKI